MRRAVLLLLCVLGALAPVIAEPVMAQTKKPTLDELRQEREAVRRQKTTAAANVDALKADDKEATQALAVLDGNVNAVRRELTDAQGELDAVERAAAAAEASRKAAEQKVAELDRAIKAAAVRSYAAGGVTSSLLLTDFGDINSAIERQTLLQVAAGDTADLVDRLDSARQDFLAEQRRTSELAAQLAAKRDLVKGRLNALTVARDQQQRFADQLDARIERALAEAASLERLDKGLADKIAAEQQAIADALAKQARERNTRSAPTPIGPISLQTVRGITVAASIANNVDALLAAAERDGIHLTGSGYRSADDQVAVRRRNCGTSDYAIWQAPSSSCRPPTARPGSSQHERGLAIDFTVNGFVLTRSSAAFQWLARNAGRFGMYNLPSEPWHWSTTGT